jgi:predicted lipid-binding transport protein (Tim44 family)
VAQPSFIQRHPLLAGIAGGLAGSWIGHMLFGATDSTARTTDSEAHESENATGPFGSPGVLLLLMLLGGGALYYFMKMRRPTQPDFSGLTRSAVLDSPQEAITLGGLATKGLERGVTSSDETAFKQILVDVQTSWSQGDLAALRRLVTPEMLHYFSTGLSENASKEVANRVEDLYVVKADVRETWTEESTDYATVSLQWSARDYTVSLAKQKGEPGYVVEGDEHAPHETIETWTFMRHQTGKWLLSAIQQMA